MATKKNTPCYAYVYEVKDGVAKIVLKMSRQYSSVSNARRAMRRNDKRHVLASSRGFRKIVDTRSLAFEMKAEMLDRRIASSVGF